MVATLRQDRHSNSWSGIPVSVREDGGSKPPSSHILLIEQKSLRYTAIKKKRFPHHNREHVAVGPVQSLSRLRREPPVTMCRYRSELMSPTRIGVTYETWNVTNIERFHPLHEVHFNCLHAAILQPRATKRRYKHRTRETLLILSRLQD